MNSLRVLGAAATLALVLPMATPSFAQGHGGHFGGGGGAHFSGGGAHFSGGGAHFGGGSFGAARPAGGNFAASAAVRPSGGATGFAGRNFAATGGQWNGGGGHWNGGNWHGGWHHHHGGGFWPGFAAGAAIGGLGSYAYYGGPYYGDGYYDDGYYDDSATVAVVPDTGGDSSAYCAQRYRSYDPASGTYLGYDGLRHPCP
ncbi:BA14K family protein [Bradyrhizobium sp. BR 10261]|uniref:BA14K family protein n=1 Tax=Bradyrhizobium sp. BR 10261 TaxID=2749992 RepID=UPI001C649C93|nr:BA14K family protein [Bradyrhizobium sp. BR 10261]MBW7963852.1 BA14K family protein [Bradyrhizobium sp. BR 10261]